MTVVNGVFKIKGRGWVMTCCPDFPLELGDLIFDEQDRYLGCVRGLEFVTNVKEVGIVLGEFTELIMPKQDDVISIVRPAGGI